MTADLIHLRASEINAVRVRVGWFGRPILQLRRTVVRGRFASAGKSWEEPHDLGEWVDAKRIDIPELAVFFAEQHAPINRFPSLEARPPCA